MAAAGERAGLSAGRGDHHRAVRQRGKRQFAILRQREIQAVGLRHALHKRGVRAAAVAARGLAPDVVARGKARDGQRQIAPEFRRGFQLILRVPVVAKILVHRAGAERIPVFHPRIRRNAAQTLLRHEVGNRHGHARRAAAALPKGARLLRFARLVAHGRPNRVVLRVILHLAAPRHVDRAARALQRVHLHLHNGDALPARVDNRAQAREDNVTFLVHLVGAGAQREQRVAPLGHNARIEPGTIQYALHKRLVFPPAAELLDAPRFLLLGGFAHAGEDLRGVILIRSDDGHRRMRPVVLLVQIIRQGREHAPVFAVVSVQIGAHIREIRRIARVGKD